MRPLFWTAFWVFLIDQATKYYVVHWLGLINAPGGRITVYPPFLEFRMAWNRGVNFGIGAGYDMRWVLIGVATAISIGVIVWLWRAGGTRNMMTSYNAGRTTGNAAFDAYKADTLRRLEDEQTNFETFLERLREAKDKAEFDQFMDERAARTAKDADDKPAS